jgi:4-amino-4-deoxychorismate lyase
MDADTNIICGTMSNVFFVHNNQITTSPLARCGVAGVMRNHAIAALKEQGIHVAFNDTKLADLGEVDEVFLSNSQFGIMPVSECDSRHWPVGDLTRTVMTILGDSGIDECRL